jgi:valyl-tRNA synthetase
MHTSSSTPARLPDKPSLDGLGEKWARYWEEHQTYRFDRSATRDRVYAIDTPPPTVSGSLHIGHVFSFAQTDFLARFHRMRGREVFYPMGWDDNGLPTERVAQKLYNVRCDPGLPYEPGLVLEKHGPRRKISRRNFIELCQSMAAEYERGYEQTWRATGLSVDWSLTYQTIGERARTLAQGAFLRNMERGEAYLAEAPTLWDITYQTAVAQAEIEFRDIDSAFYDIEFDGPAGPLTIATTRPELLAACVALVAHPDDVRFRDFFGSSARTPLFQAEVPILPHRAADPEQGTGLVMVCTFGDLTDVVWWRDLGLPIRAILGRDGRLLPDATSGVDGAAYARIAGQSVSQARETVIEALGEAITGQRRMRHPVKFYENGDQPLEIVTSRQWYITNGARDERLRTELLRRGEELTWHPAHMHTRYESWVAGLTGDWLISRQRFSGVPIPVWYALDDNGEPLYDKPIRPEHDSLPVDPRSTTPPGYAESTRDKPGGFTADPDVMDTWATSSLSPILAAGDLLPQVFPMDLRPQAHEIIRTWLFSTVLRTQLEYDTLPWKNTVISGWVLTHAMSKMSKSRGTTTNPAVSFEEFGPDAVRYWAACGRPGIDTAFSPDQMRIGRRLAVKLLNAGRFILGLSASPGEVTAALDLAMLARLSSTVEEATARFESYDYTGALAVTERFFWEFCDDYLELAKARAYGSPFSEAESGSAVAAMRQALDTLLRLFAPILPFVTEEIWSWFQSGSLHRASWPSAAASSSSSAALSAASEVIGAVRKAKSSAKLSQRTPAALVSVSADIATLDALRSVEADLRAAGRIESLVLTEGSPTTTVTL